MSTAARARIAIIGAFACAALLVLGAFSFASAQTNTCPAGQQPATASDIATMLAAGINSPVVGMCWTPSSNQIGTQAAQAKQYLQSDVCPGNSIDTADLNTGFALCAQKFVQAARAQDSGFCLTSAYRSVASQQAIVTANDAKFHCPANTWCPTMAGYIAQPGGSFHQYGLAIDVHTTVINQTPVLSYQTIWNLAQAQGIINPTALHSSDPYHIQAQSKTAGTICNSNGSNTNIAGGSNISITPGQGIGQALGLTSSQPLAGQIASQDTYCLISTNPIVTIPVAAGTAYPSNCLNTSSGTGMCVAQTYCSGNTVMYQTSSCTPTQGQTCPYGCSNGGCIQQQQQAQQYPQTSPATTPSTGSNSGTTGTSGTSGTSGSVGSSPTGSVSGTTQTGSNLGSSGTSGSTGSGSSINIPTLANNNGTSNTAAASTIAGTSTLAILDQLANEAPPGPTVTPATDTPIVLNGNDNQVSQLEPAGMPGVTYANSGSSGTASAGQENSGPYDTSSGSGYDNGGSQSTTGDTSGTIAGTDQPSGSDTFENQQTPPPATESSSFAGTSADTFGTLALLNTLKTEVEGALAFLSTYAQPFQGNIPSQNVGE